MAKPKRARHGTASRPIRSRPCKAPIADQVVGRSMIAEECSKREWEDVICSVCMEQPHNAVLLLCSSHEKGCRPYMCGTSFRYSNCLDQYRKASAKLMSSNQELPDCKSKLLKLVCPLCRGQVKGWTIVQPARDYMNMKKRSCMQETCSFVGAFMELRKHMRKEHACARPREVDPGVEQQWRRLEHGRERDDVVSTIRSTMPEAMIVGDYVIERGIDEGLGRSLVNAFLLLQAFGPQVDQTSLSSDSTTTTTIHGGGGGHMDPLGQEGGGSVSLASRLRRQGQILLGRAGRRRRNRVASLNPNARS